MTNPALDRHSEACARRRHATRPTYAICPGDRIEVEVVQPDGGRALVVGKLDAVPEAAGGQALKIRVCDVSITRLPVK